MGKITHTYNHRPLYNQDDVEPVSVSKPIDTFDKEASLHIQSTVSTEEIEPHRPGVRRACDLLLGRQPALSQSSISFDKETERKLDELAKRFPRIIEKVRTYKENSAYTNFKTVADEKNDPRLLFVEDFISFLEKYDAQGAVNWNSHVKIPRLQELFGKYDFNWLENNNYGIADNDIRQMSLTQGDGAIVDKFVANRRTRPIPIKIRNFYHQLKKRMSATDGAAKSIDRVIADNFDEIMWSRYLTPFLLAIGDVESRLSSLKLFSQHRHSLFNHMYQQQVVQAKRQLEDFKAKLRTIDFNKELFLPHEIKLIREAMRESIRIFEDILVLYTKSHNTTLANELLYVAEQTSIPALKELVITAAATIQKNLETSDLSTLHSGVIKNLGAFLKPHNARDVRKIRQLQSRTRSIPSKHPVLRIQPPEVCLRPIKSEMLSHFYQSISASEMCSRLLGRKLFVNESEFDTIIDSWFDLAPSLIADIEVIIDFARTIGQNHPKLIKINNLFHEMSSMKDAPPEEKLSVHQRLSKLFQETNFGSDFTIVEPHILRILENPYLNFARGEKELHPFYERTISDQRHQNDKFGHIIPVGRVDRKEHHYCGKVLIIPNPDTRSWELVAISQGTKSLSFTQNYFMTEKEAQHSTKHDDNSYGHGVVISATHPIARVKFAEDGRYNGKKIKAGKYVRLGLRGFGYKVIKLPELGDDIQMFDFTDLKWYRKSTQQPASSDMSIEDVKGLLDLDGVAPKTKSKGYFEIKRQKTGWSILLKNTGPQSFIGTVSFEDAKGKNDGLGLESMPVENKGSSAQQNIIEGKHYGVKAKAGQVLRVGIRGFGSTNIPLPEDGVTRVFLPLEVEPNSTHVNTQFYDRKNIREKVREKLNDVTFSDAGTELNLVLGPDVFQGTNALARATFNPTSIHMSQTNPGEVTFTFDHKLPKEDVYGPLHPIIKFSAISGMKKQDDKVLDLNSGSNTISIDTTTLSNDAMIHIEQVGLGWYHEFPASIAHALATKPEMLDEFLFFREDMQKRALLSRSQ